jgi:hypothetical protein
VEAHAFSLVSPAADPAWPNIDRAVDFRLDKSDICGKVVTSRTESVADGSTHADERGMVEFDESETACVEGPGMTGTEGA